MSDSMIRCNKIGRVNGIHLLGEWFGCPATAAMVSADVLRPLCLDAVKAAGLTPLGHTFHQFSPQGVTGLVLLAESHLAVHTWPETGFATVDVYVCNVSTDNGNRAHALYDAIKRVLQPREAREHIVHRGPERPDASRQVA